MLKVLIYDSVAQIRIAGDKFMDDLDTLRAIPRADRSFKDGVWTVRHYERYTHIPAIRAAIQDRKAQLTLF